MPIKNLNRHYLVSRLRLQLTEIHGDKYDYSKLNYTAHGKILIGCPRHGFLKVSRRYHLKSGCPKCNRADLNKSESVVKTKTKILIRQFKKAHGDKYDYSKIVWEANKSSYSIGCPVHGFYEQAGSNHKRGFGCPQCGIRGDSRESFIEKAKAIHGNTYSYRKINYVGSQTKIDIKCREHGMFKQTPNNHLMGQGCPECWKTNRLKIIRNASYRYYSFEYKGKTFTKLQGFEYLAIKYLLDYKNIKPSDLKTSDQIKPIQYKSKVKAKIPYIKMREYWPDLYLPKKNTIIEVKSVYTLLLAYPNLLEKRKAVKELGMKFKLIVFDKNKNRLTLPKKWYKLSKDELEKLLATTKKSKL